MIAIICVLSAIMILLCIATITYLIRLDKELGNLTDTLSFLHRNVEQRIKELEDDFAKVKYIKNYNKRRE